MTLTLTPTTPGHLYLTAPYPLAAIGWFNVKDYGAAGDGVTDDTASIAATIVAAAVGGGNVVCPPGTYVISSAVVVPSYVNLIGGGGSMTGAVTIFKCTAAAAKISFGALATTSAGGTSGGFKINGNSVATNPLFVGLTVGRVFTDICVTAAAAGSSGVLIQQAQNCTFIGLDIQSCAADGLTLDRGTGGHVFIRTQTYNSGRYNVLFTQSAASATDTALGLFGVPELNTFYGGDFEGQLGTQAANVLHEAGLFNTFHKVAMTSNTTAAHSIVKVSLGGVGTPGSNYLRLVDCYLLGNATFVTGVTVDNGCGVYIEDTAFLALLNGVSEAIGSSVQGAVSDSLFLSVTNSFAGTAATNKVGLRTIGNLRALDGLGTNHVAGATPTGGVSGDIKVGTGKVWVNDAGTWKSAVVA